MNEDLEMVYFLCRKGADVHQRLFNINSTCKNSFENSDAMDLFFVLMIKKRQELIHLSTSG